MSENLEEENQENQEESSGQGEIIFGDETVQEQANQETNQETGHETDTTDQGHDTENMLDLSGTPERDDVIRSYSHDENPTGTGVFASTQTTFDLNEMASTAAAGKVSIVHVTNSNGDAVPGEYTAVFDGEGGYTLRNTAGEPVAVYKPDGNGGFNTYDATGNNPIDTNIRVTDVVDANPYATKNDNYTQITNQPIEVGVEGEGGVLTFSSEEAYVTYLMHSKQIDEATARQLAQENKDNGLVIYDSAVTPNVQSLAEIFGYEQDQTKKTGFINGVGSFDRVDMHDEYMHETHVTQKVGTGDYYNESGYYNADGTKHEGTIDLTNYNTLVTDPHLTTLLNTNNTTKKDGYSYSGNPLGTTDTSKFSKLDYLATYAASGQHDTIDLSLMLDALEENGQEFAAHPEHYFFGTDYEVKYEALAENGGKFSYTADDLRQEIEELNGQVKALHDLIISWEGNASSQEKNAMETIVGKFEVWIGNFNNAIEPACDAIDNLFAQLELLKAGEEELNGMLGEGTTANGTYIERNKKQIEADFAAAGLTPGNEPEKNGVIGSKTVYDKDSNDKKIPIDANDLSKGYKSHQEDVIGETEAHKTYVKLQAELEALEAEIETKKCELDKILIEVIRLYHEITNYETALDTFESYFTVGTKRTRGSTYDPSRAEWVSSKENLLANHNNLISDFQDFSLMPVITPISGYYVPLDEPDEYGKTYKYEPYKEGDVIIHDDGHGNYYVVTGPFDPLTGTIRIACYDKDGNKIGEDVTIWDQREIVPVRYVRDIFPEEYTTVPDNIFTTTPETTTTPTSTKTGTGTSRTTTPSQTTTPSSTTQPSYTTAPYNPHTGLDAMYSANGNSGQSSAGLGAMAGLAVGAAGLGLTGLVGNKDKDKDKDEDKKEDAAEEKKDDNSPMFSLNHPVETSDNPAVSQVMGGNNIIQ